MKLFIDMGNTSLKWQLRRNGIVRCSGRGELGAATLFDAAKDEAAAICGIEVSSVASECQQQDLVRVLCEWASAPVRFHLTEPRRNGLVCAYGKPESMGADRWHALYGCWLKAQGPLIVVDAGSAVTVDVVEAGGLHLGGYILPGRRMMLRSLRQDVARVGFNDEALTATRLGKSTSECVYHGLVWLWQGLVEQVRSIALQEGIKNLYVTGGDAGQLMALGLEAQHIPDIVFEGLAAIVTELEQQ